MASNSASSGSSFSGESFVSASDSTCSEPKDRLRHFNQDAERQCTNAVLPFGHAGYELLEKARGDDTHTAGGFLQDSDVKLFSLLCMINCLEGADSILLPCVFFALQLDLGLSLGQMAALSTVQAVCTNFASPMWAALADRRMLRRKSIIVAGCVFQGLSTMALAGVDQMWIMVILRAFTGTFLACLRPIANGIVADITAEVHRGKAYGITDGAVKLGRILGTLIGTNLARSAVLGLQGWRVAFLIVGSTSVVVGIITSLAMEEPPRLSKAPVSSEVGMAAVKEELGEVSTYFRMPSFCVLVLQGCFGGFPWRALSYKTLFFQVSGLSDLQASLIDVFSQLAASVGSFLGGAVGDSLSRCTPNHGRPITAEISVFAGIPIVWLVFVSAPPEDCAFVYYAFLMTLFGLTATWCSGVNKPILSQIVKSDRKASIMAWATSLENSWATVFGHVVVGLLAEGLFGYDLSTVRGATLHPDSSNKRALGSTLALLSALPWSLCLVCYSLLHWSYPRDLKRLESRAPA